MTELGLGQELTLGAIIVSIGVIGIILNRKSLIVILMSIELVLLAGNLKLVALSIYLGDLTGKVFTLFILIVSRLLSSIALVTCIPRGLAVVQLKAVLHLNAPSTSFTISSLCFEALSRESNTNR